MGKGGVTVEDFELLRRARSGDRAAFGALFDRHRDYAFRVALGILGRREDAVEVVQEVFLALWRNPPDPDAGRGRLTTWLFTVTHRRALDASRRRGRVDAGMERGRPATPEQSLLDREKHLRLAAVVGELSERQREVFLLRVGLGATVEETAATLRCSEGAVRTALHEATREIRERLARGLGRGELHERR